MFNRKEMPLIVYYNTLCPVCNAGINRYQREMIDLIKSGDLEYRDINLEPDRFSERNISVNDVRKRLHALEDETLLVGADVAIAIWKRMPSRQILGTLLGLPIARNFTRLGYNLLAEILFFWNRRKGRW